MGEFKSGDTVISRGYGAETFTYCCIHPRHSDYSIVVKNNAGTALLYTRNLTLVPKTHTVKGFEVPAPMSESEFDEIGDLDMLYGFSPNYSLGYNGIIKCHISIVSVKCGFVFKTESDVKKNIAALQGIDPDTVE